VIDFLVHHPDDGVGVVVVETVQAGQTLQGRTLQGTEVASVQATESIPLGHKIALRDMDADQTVLEYGHDIGVTVAGHVHVHNIKTKRW
jgi:(2R)-sulfolactate sulfo-lyase subunit alpha